MNGSTAPIRIVGRQALDLDALTRHPLRHGTPCADDPRFINDRPTVQHDAARECQACPILAECAAYGHTPTGSNAACTGR